MLLAKLAISPYQYQREIFSISDPPKGQDSGASKHADTFCAPRIRAIGKQQARRFNAAARLSAQQRDTITNFLNDMAQEITLPDGQWDTPDPTDR